MRQLSEIQKSSVGLNNFLRLLSQRDTVMSLANQLWKLVSGPLNMVLITVFLLPEVQGYWYTFINISALSAFADLGFSNIVLQFSAHEFAHLTFEKGKVVEQTSQYFKRLSSFFLFSIQWIFRMICIVFPVIIVVGYWMFSQKVSAVNWLVPWGLYVLGSALFFFNNTILSFIEGCNFVGKVQEIRLKASIVYYAATFILLWRGAGLYALALPMLIQAVTVLFYTIASFYSFLKQLMFGSRGFKYSWRKEFSGLLWKYAVSFVSGYFTSRIYAPLSFMFYDADTAGKVGLTMTLWMNFFFVCNIWIYTITPKLNMLVSNKQWSELDKVFKIRMKYSIFTYAFGFFMVMLFYTVLQGKVHFLTRFMGIPSMICLGAGWFLQIIFNGIAVYLRAFKQEPLMFTSLATAIFVCCTTFIIVQIFPNHFIFLGFLGSYLWSIPLALRIFKQKRVECKYGASFT